VATAARSAKVNRKDALRKVRALRNVTLASGALPAEVDNAGRLSKRIAERFAIECEERQEQPRPTQSSATWDYWRWLLSEFRIEARRFCNRASGAMGTDRLIVIRLDTSEWQIQRQTLAGYQTVVKQRGLESLRHYLQENAPRGYSFAQV
jgi:hypothetical protein